MIRILSLSLIGLLSFAACGRAAEEIIRPDRNEPPSQTKAPFDTEVTSRADEQDSAPSSPQIPANVPATETPIGPHIPISGLWLLPCAQDQQSGVEISEEGIYPVAMYATTITYSLGAACRSDLVEAIRRVEFRSGIAFGDISGRLGELNYRARRRNPLTGVTATFNVFDVFASNGEVLRLGNIEDEHIGWRPDNRPTMLAPEIYRKLEPTQIEGLLGDFSAPDCIGHGKQSVQFRPGGRLMFTHSYTHDPTSDCSFHTTEAEYYSGEFFVGNQVSPGTYELTIYGRGHGPFDHIARRAPDSVPISTFTTIRFQDGVLRFGNLLANPERDGSTPDKRPEAFNSQEFD